MYSYHIWVQEGDVSDIHGFRRGDVSDIHANVETVDNQSVASLISFPDCSGLN